MATSWAVFEYQWVTFRRIWRSTVSVTLILPLLTVLGFGVGVGSYVPEVGGVPYLSYVVTGLIASTALQSAVAESSWPVLDAFTWSKIQFAHASTPARPVHLALGRLAYVVTRVMIPVVAFLLVAYAFGVPTSGWAWTAIPACALLAWASAAPSMALAATVSSDNELNLVYRLAVVPLTLFSGIFFPVAQLPEVLRWLAYASPLWHGVDLCRSAIVDAPPEWPLWRHLVVLGVWGVAGTWLSVRTFTRRLAQ